MRSVFFYLARHVQELHIFLGLKIVKTLEEVDRTVFSLQTILAAVGLRTQHSILCFSAQTAEIFDSV